MVPVDSKHNNKIYRPVFDSKGVVTSLIWLHN